MIRAKQMPPSLSVALKREFILSVILEAAAVFQELMHLKSSPRFRLSIPPGVKSSVRDIGSEFLGLGFPGVYVQLEDDSDVLVDVGVITTYTPGSPPEAYFAGGRSREGKVLVAALAIAASTLTRSCIEDGSGHWMSRDQFTAEELRTAMSPAKRRAQDDEFVGYVGSPDFHDGFVKGVSVEGNTAEVVVEGYSGREYVVFFEGVDGVEKNAPEGMLLYSLSEMRATPPLRKFVFANNDEDHPGLLSIVAKDFRVCPK